MKMKMRIITAVVIAAVLTLTITVPQVQAFAFSALSVFRVGDAKTITITIDDITLMAEQAKESITSGMKNPKEHISGTENGSIDKSDYKTLSNASEFTAFNVKLPRELNDQKPELFATDVMDKSIEMPNGESISISLSPSFIAKYENVVFMATQGMNNDMNQELKTEMWQKLLAAPILTDNIRSQLAAIDPNTKDIYLPVITGISREVDLGGSTGYLYATSDMQSIMGALPTELTAGFSNKMNEAVSAEGTQSEHKNMNVIIWTKGGVLYILVGDLSDSELAAIARSVR